MSNTYKYQEYFKAIEAVFLISKIDHDGVIIDANNIFCDAVGYTKKELLGKTYNFLCDKEMSQEEFAKMLKTLHAKKIYKKLFQFKTKDKEVVYLNTTVVAISNEKKKITEFLSIGYDATLEIQMMQDLNQTMQSLLRKEQLLMHQSKLTHMSEMIGMIAHQWRQPLAAISATTIDLDIKLALNNFDENHFSQKFKNITEYTEFLSKTIDDFKNFFTVDAKEEVTNFEKIVNSVISLMGVSLRNRMIDLTLDLENAKPIKVFTSELQQIILGILKTFEDEFVLHHISTPAIHIYTYSKDGYETLRIEANIIQEQPTSLQESLLPLQDEKLVLENKLDIPMSQALLKEHCDGFSDIFIDDKGVHAILRIPSFS